MILLGLSLLCATAHSTEVFWDGMYRLRGQYFDTLSLSDSNTFSEGSSNALTHRFRLQPSWRISPALSIHSQLKYSSLPAIWGRGAVLSQPNPNPESLSRLRSEHQLLPDHETLGRSIHRQG